MNETNTLEISESSGLINQTSREKTLKKLESLKVNNLTAREKEIIDQYENNFIIRFLELCWETLGVSRNQLRELTKEELKGIDDLLAEKVKSRAVWQKIAFTSLLFIPLLGWGIAEELYPSLDCAAGCPVWGYLRDRKVLKKTYGKDYFPYEELEKKLKKQ